MTSNSISIVPASERFAESIPDLVHSTGPVSYDFIFLQDRDLLDAFVRRAWAASDTLFGYGEATVAVRDDELLGIEIGYPGSRYYELRDGGTDVAVAMVEAGEATPEQLRDVGLRSYKNDFQLPYVPPDAYYVMALAVREECRGEGIGARLLNEAFGRAKSDGFRTLHLDVLSDNPAVDFYRRMGMTCMVESSTPELRIEHGIPAEYRMVKELS